MTTKNKKPQMPTQRVDTVRHEIISAITGAALSAKEISSIVGISEKDVSPHLEHIKLTLHKTNPSHGRSNPYRNTFKVQEVRLCF